ncbi:hypothetical protein F3Y22_tig00116958pilonHSYRG00352 [Hibiscus syriacus]|uniref:Leucine-rich repeat-containing N-terminal plant-type domain-containing protein n=1 Tax=Hibiscus syriacus TaxID=106335 RepID=A0A6A2XDM5_HIBSY|nr:hypothetical protein F3Y22_tig00116958pilonHSYRG00352 [Hibiscus syriacus]
MIMDDSKRFGTVVLLEFLCLNLLASWSSNGGNCCDWTGIVCDNVTGRIVELHLGNLRNPSDETAFPGKPFKRSRLSGKVDSLLGLKHLGYLDLSGNNFGGQIPGFLGSLHSLRYLIFSNAGFEGSIPAQLGNLTNVQYLDDALYDSLNASDWFEVTSALPSLSVLHLSDCDLDPFPPLKTVNFSTLSKKHDLSYLSQLIKQPIQFIHTRHNLEDVENLTSAISLIFTNNNLEGAALRSLGNLCSLTNLVLSGVRLNQDMSQVLESLSGCMSNRLESLFLVNCIISGHLSNQIGLFRNLRFLYLTKNSISGSIPDSLRTLASLREVNISENRFNGSLLEWLGELKELEVLWIGKNMLQGAVSELKQTPNHPTGVIGGMPESTGLRIDCAEACHGVHRHEPACVVAPWSDLGGAIVAIVSISSSTSSRMASRGAVG